MRIGFIGLGVMGYPMAGHLAQAGYDVLVYNRTQHIALKWAQTYSGQAVKELSELARQVDILCLCVGRDEDVREVLVEQQVFNHLPAGAIVIDHTTTSAELAREMAACAKEQQLTFVDAPVSGGQSGAEQGQLTIMVGSDEATYTRIQDVLAVYAKQLKRVGETGQGQLTKMVNQICIAGIVQGLAEAMNFVKQAGLDGDAVLDVISQGAAQSWQMDNRAQTMLAGQYDFGFAIDWMRKDLGYALAEAKTNGASLPITALVDQFYADVQNMGGQRWDTSALMARLTR